MGRNTGDKNIRYINGLSDEAATNLVNQFKGEAELWQKRFAEKEKECEELMQELKAKYFYTEALRREIEELKAENERLKEGLRQIANDFPEWNPTEQKYDTQITASQLLNK